MASLSPSPNVALAKATALLNGDEPSLEQARSLIHILERLTDPEAKVSARALRRLLPGG